MLSADDRMLLSDGTREGTVKTGGRYMLI